MELFITIVTTLIHVTWQTIKGMLETMPALFELKSVISLFTLPGIIGMCIGIPAFVVSLGIKLCRKAIKW